MSNVSIYEKNWTDLVFEHRNKEYGAYQLRNESPKTTLLAFFIGTLFILSLIGAWMLFSSFGTKVVEDTLIPDNETITVVDLTVKPDVVKPLENKKQPAETPTQQPLVNNAPLEVVSTANATVEVPQNIDIVTPSTDAGNGPAGPAINAPSTNGGPAAIPDDGGDRTHTTVELDRLPEYPGGIKKFYEYVGNSIEKEQFEDTGSSINVIMSFVIEKDGTMTDIKALRSSDKRLEKEAIRVLKASKIKWSPGYLNNEKVRTQYTLPIKVAI